MSCFCYLEYIWTELKEGYEEESQRLDLQAANKRAKEAGFQAQVLQGQLREVEAILERERQELRVAQEVQAAAGADLRQLEEERKAMLVRISQFEEEKFRDMEPAANRESEQMRASIEAQHSRILKDLERQTQARAGESARLLKELEDWKAECMRLRGDCGGEQRAKVELEQRHAAVITELESLREKLREQDAAECRRFVDEIQGRKLWNNLGVIKKFLQLRKRHIETMVYNLIRRKRFAVIFTPRSGELKWRVEEAWWGRLAGGYWDWRNCLRKWRKQDQWMNAKLKAC
eukprot:s780_g14.t1